MVVFLSFTVKYLNHFTIKLQLFIMLTYCCLFVDNYDLLFFCEELTLKLFGVLFL